MGTNYYAKIGGHRCPVCEGLHDATELHIGKSSAGWNFSVCVYVDPWDEAWMPKSWDEWKVLLSKGDAEISNEYDDVVSLEQLIKTVENRSHPHGLRSHADIVDFKQCVGRGEGTWDHMRPGFS